MSRLFGEDPGKYYQLPNADERYALLDWTDTIYGTLYRTLRTTDVGDMMPEHLALSGPPRGEERDKYWFFYTNSRLTLVDGDAVFVSPREFIRTHEYVFLDHSNKRREFKLTRSKFRADDPFYESLEAEYSPLAIARKPYYSEDQVKIDQVIIFQIPITGDSPDDIVSDLLDQKEELLRAANREFLGLAGPEGYMVKLKDLKLEITPPEEGRYFVGDYRGIELSEKPAILDAIYRFHYVDTSITRTNMGPIPTKILEKNA